MSDTRYPTRMHEVLGVETGERFKIEKVPDEFFLNHEGRMIVVTDGRVFNSCRMFNSSGDILTDAINHGIIRKPRLSEEQVKQLKALVTLGYYWLVVQGDGGYGYAYACEDEPAKDNGSWTWFGSCYRLRKGWKQGELYALVSWSDPEPLDIVQVLRENGVEVDDG